MKADDIIKKLNLVPLAHEGGYYKRTWVSDINLDMRPLGTAIFFLLLNTIDGFSALHTLPFPEIYHFYLGDPMELSLFHKNGKVEQIIMGQDILNGELLQFTVPGNVVQGSRIVRGGKFALIGTTMSPGFTFDDFYLNSKEDMVERYPESRELILSLTREEQEQ